MNKKIISVFSIIALIALMPIYMVYAGVTDSGSGSIKRESVYAYHTTIVFNGTYGEEEYTKTKEEIEVDISDEIFQQEIEKMSEEFNDWVIQKGGESSEILEQGVTNSYFEVHDEIINDYEEGEFVPTITIRTILDKYQTYTINAIGIGSIKGDINKDGKINSSDAALALAIYNSGESTSEQKILGDMDGDGKVNSSDAAAILSIYSAK